MARGRPKKPPHLRAQRDPHPRTWPVYVGDRADEIVMAIMEVMPPHPGKGAQPYRQLVADLIHFELEELRPQGRQLPQGRVFDPEIGARLRQIFRKHDAQPVRVGTAVVLSSQRLTRIEKTSWAAQRQGLKAAGWDKQRINDYRTGWAKSCRHQVTRVVEAPKSCERTLDDKPFRHYLGIAHAVIARLSSKQ